MPTNRILVADDDPFLRDFVRHNLGLLGYQVVLARDGQEAVDKTYVVRPDLVVLDMLMPELNGMEALALLKADPDTADIPVLMLTALRGESDVRGAIRLGAAGYLAKPFQLQNFAGRVHHLMLARRSTSAPASPSVHMLH